MTRRGHLCLALYGLVMLLLPVSTKANIRSQTAKVGDTFTTLECLFEEPSHKFTTTTIEWIKDSPRSTNGPTLMQIVNYTLTGVVAYRYESTPEGGLVINNVMESDSGTYRCLVIFTLITPINDNGYITLHDTVQLQVTDNSSVVQMFLKKRGLRRGSVDVLKMKRRRSETIVCQTRSTKEATIKWNMDHRNDVESLPSYKIGTTKSVVYYGTVITTSEIVLNPRQGKAVTQFLITLSCTATVDDTDGEQQSVASRTMMIQVSSKKDKRKSKSGKDRRRRKGRKERKRGRRYRP
ncbi:uncharacterized protein LOC144440473 [Glandiceps talaboti]